MRPWALPLLGALCLSACAKPEPPPLKLDCALGFEALSGRIFLDSPHGAGTTLRVELPLTDPDPGLRPAPQRW